MLKKQPFTQGQLKILMLLLILFLRFRNRVTHTKAVEMFISVLESLKNMANCHISHWRIWNPVPELTFPKSKKTRWIFACGKPLNLASRFGNHLGETVARVGTLNVLPWRDVI